MVCSKHNEIINFKNTFWIILFLLPFLSCTVDKKEYNKYPECNIVSPKDGSRFYLDDSAFINIDADDIDGYITEVEIILPNNKQILIDKFPYQYDWNLHSGQLGYNRIEVYATDNSGNKSRRIITIYINVNNAKFRGWPTVTNTIEKVQFIDQSENHPTSWLWDFGDGETSSLQDPYHTYKKSGLYNVSLAITNSSSSDSIFKNNYITVINSNECTNCEFDTIVDIDSNIYRTVKIGKQWWMAENLRTTKYNDGTLIPKNEKSEYLSTPAYRWPTQYNEASYKNIYGALYNWHVVNTEKLCPSGWHVSSDDEWITLELYLQKNGYNYDGTTDDDNNRFTNDKIAKSLASSIGWDKSDKLGVPGNLDYPSKRNATGFSALPSLSYGGGKVADFWTSTAVSNSHAKCIELINDRSGIVRNGGFPHHDSYSVRCVKD